MKTIYYPQDDILEIRLSDKPIAREVSQDWNVNVSATPRTAPSWRW